MEFASFVLRSPALSHQAEISSPVGSGKWYKGAYEPIVSKELFKEAQEKMAVPPKSMPGTKTKEFTFTKLLKCGSCGSGITAHEVVKIRKVGPKQYAYYHCTKLKDFSCHEPYISEKGLIQEFIRVLKDLTIDQLKTNKQIYEKFEEYRKFRSEVLDIELKENQTNEVDLDNISIRKFSEYIFEKGSREEKRDLIGCLNTTFYLKDRIISG